MVPNATTGGNLGLSGVSAALRQKTMGDYNILTVTHGGTVSILKGLSKDEAIEAGRRLTPFYLRPDWKCPDGGYSWSSRDADIERLEIWGPEGAELNVWDGYSPAHG